MKLTPADAELFYELMWSLQFYANQRLGLLPGVASLAAYKRLAQDDKLKVRTALYEHGELFDAFVSENPAKLSATELDIVSDWRRFVAGEFYIERYLKKGAIFITSADPPQVYVVLGLNDSLQEMLDPYLPTPTLVQTVLLPFKGGIVYDGLLSTYNIVFGTNMRWEMKEIYMAAKQNGRIIESLEPGRPQLSTQTVGRDWGPQVAEVMKAANKLKGEGVPIQTEAFALLKASGQLAQLATATPVDLETVWKALAKTERALRKLETVLNRAEM